MKTPPRTGGALEGFSENVKQFSKFKLSRAPLQPPCVPTLPRAWKHLGAVRAGIVVRLAQENESCWVLRR